MYVDERTVAASMAEPLAPAAGFGWFAARQPGILRFMEERLCGDALAVGLAGAWQIVTAFQRHDGIPPMRLTGALLEQAEEAVVREARGEAPDGDDGCVARQPVLVAWIAGSLADTPVPLSVVERGEVGLALTAVVYALDQATTGRDIGRPPPGTGDGDVSV